MPDERQGEGVPPPGSLHLPNPEAAALGSARSRETKASGPLGAGATKLEVR